MAKSGDAASLVLIDASCSAEAVARRSERKAVFYKGNIVSGSLYLQNQSITCNANLKDLWTRPDFLFRIG